MITKDSPGVEIELTALEEDDSDIAGHFASDEPEEDAKMVADIARRASNGDTWAWCVARVRVTYQGIVAVDYLGGCSYADAAEFRAGDYFDDMVSTCIDQVNATLASIAACELAPHNRAIIACVCGYKRHAD